MQNVSKIGNYIAVDPVRNFRIGVKLGRIVTDLSIEGSSLVYDEEIIIHWQQKLFSPKERLFYSNASNCTTETHQNYHKEISSMKYFNKRIFTYTETDDFSSQIISPLDRGISACSFPLRKLQKVNLQLIPERLIKNTTQPGFGLVVENPSSVQTLIHHLPVKPGRVMYIMADLSEDIQELTEITEEDNCSKSVDEEVVLCILSLSSNNVLSVLPDFSQGSVPYKITSPKSHNFFQYELTHMSPQISLVEQEKENKLLEEIILRENARLNTLIGNQFEMPEQQTFRLFVVGEIVYAKLFEYSGLYVQYFLELPQSKFTWQISKTWFIHQIGEHLTIGYYKETLKYPMCGILMTLDRFLFPFQEQVSNFSHPIEFDLAYKREIKVDPKQPNAFKWPVLFFEVTSLDFWTRTRTEGYGYVELPRTAGEHVIEVQCWRPVGESVVDELRRFFVGGTCQLEDITYTGIPGTLEDKHLVKYGFRTQTTGIVKFRLNCAVQSWVNMHKHVTKNAIKATDMEKKVALSHLDVASVIRAYQHARNRLLETRQIVERFSKTHLD
ncbi:hypothetical protein D915_008786 [Fasciola hepatica]|uniref:Meckel syndrome type 1 protein n=1 Tax=Fasciola hepatica TaxID=6192 RepID=A0A4E0R4M5_FASHE|nr:hypothetical protein D915_008786 [Fasciola hepatica]